MSIPSLPLPEQLTIVLNEGSYLTMRFGEQGDQINLYHLGRFFAEPTLIRLSYPASKWQWKNP